MTPSKIFALIFTLLVCVQITSAKSKWEERADWGKHFSAAHVSGSFLLYDLQADKYLGYNCQLSPQIGWWVGYVERGDKAYFFAVNIDITRDKDAEARTAIAKAILREMKIIE